jgi:hypothetical protein
VEFIALVRPKRLKSNTKIVLVAGFFPFKYFGIPVYFKK